MIDTTAVRQWTFPVLRQTYTEKDAILYALALGYGSDPGDPRQLSYVYERGLKVVPTFANVLCHPGFWISDPRTGIDATRAVHGEQRVRLHAPLPPRGCVRGETRVLDIVDKGKGKGALLVFQRQLFDDETGTLLATIEQHTLCRGDGGFSGAEPSPSPRGNVQSSPTRPADVVVEMPVLPQAALVYRLSADPNPLHADPQVALAAGFPRPILHGMCTFGMACRALVQACAGDVPTRLASMSGRFSAPMFPGEVLRIEIWREDPSAVRFRCVVPARDTAVLTGGTATFH